MRAVQHEAASAAAVAPGDHSKLMRAAIAALGATRLPDYKLVFISDAGEERIKADWKEELEPRGLLPDLDSLWPDAILVRDSDLSLWFIDAVTTDGEIDETRRAELDAWATARGYTVAGYTTAYETSKRTAARQGRMKSCRRYDIWVAEDGGISCRTACASCSSPRRSCGASHRTGRARGSQVGQRKPLRAGRLVLDLPGPAQGIHRFVDRQKDRRLQRAKRPAATDRQRNRGHGHVVGSLPQVVAVVRAEGVPEPVELPADRLDVRLGGLSTVLRVADQPGPGLRRVAELR